MAKVQSKDDSLPLIRMKLPIKKLQNGAWRPSEVGEKFDNLIRASSE